MTINGDLLKLYERLTYRPGSLRNRPGSDLESVAGFGFALDNPPLLLGGCVTGIRLRVDGREVDPEDVEVTTAAERRRASRIDASHPLCYAIGAGSEYEVRFPGGLAAGRHVLELFMRPLGFGDIWNIFRFTARLSGEPSLRCERGMEKAVVFGNGEAFAVLNRVGDLSAAWTWWGVTSDNGGLYRPPARLTRGIRLGLRRGGRTAWFVEEAREAVHHPGYLEAVADFGPLRARRTTFLPPAGAGVISRLWLHNAGGEPESLSVLLEVEPDLLPYSFVGAKVNGYRLAYLPDLKAVSWELPATGYRFLVGADRTPGSFAWLDETGRDGTGVRRADRPETALSWPGRGARLQVEYSLTVPPAADEHLTFAVAGDAGGGPSGRGGQGEDRLGWYPQWLSRYDVLLAEVHGAARGYLEDTVAIRTPDRRLDTAHAFARLALRTLRFTDPEIGAGIVAGLPRFPNYWSRDSIWAAFGLLASGDHPSVRIILENFLSRQADSGDIPAVISGREFMHRLSYGGSIDGALLLPSAVARYVAFSGDVEWLARWWPSVRRALAWAEGRDEDGDGFLEHGVAETGQTSNLMEIPDITWMDHVDRRVQANDVQGLWWQALREAAWLGEIMAEPEAAARWRDMADRSERRFAETYWYAGGGYYYDRRRADGSWDPALRPNFLINLLFARRLPSWQTESALTRVESLDLTAEHGVRTRSQADTGYDAGEYQDGAVWNLTTGWAAMAEYRYGRADRGYRYLTMLCRRIEDEFGMMSELYRGDRPEPFNGCILQAWSAAVLPWVVLHGVFGLQVDAVAGKVDVHPQFPPEWDDAQLYGLPWQGGRVHFSWQREGRRLRLTVRNDSPVPLSLSFAGEERRVGPQAEEQLVRTVMTGA